MDMDGTSTSMTSTFSRTEPEHFLGEEWRACFRRLHIVPAARWVLVADLAAFLAEWAYFMAYIGTRLDAVSCLQLSWTLIAFSMALPALLPKGEQRHNYLWPLIVLKILECSICLLALLLIFTLSVSGPFGFTVLRWLIRWKYRQIEDKDVVTFSLTTFLVIALLLVINCYVLHTLCRLRTYLRQKSLSMYAQHRSQIMRSIMTIQ